jgi:prepilin-type N-terminal cleavage/methylation domain-containing protein
MYFKRSSPSSRSSGFSLVELLVVLAIIALMTALLSPALSSLSQSQNFSANVAEISNLIKQAKANAMAQNTFVWLGFASSTSNGSPLIAISAVAGTGGLSTDLANGNTAPVMKPLVLRNVQIVSSVGLNFSATLNNPAVYNTTNNTDLLSFTPTPSVSFSQSVAGQTTTFTPVIIFTPDGEATLETPTQPFQCIGIGLKAGPLAAVNAQVAAIQISGLSAEPTLFRQ